MILDISEDMVREHFSNVQLNVMGEESLLEKISPVLRQWELRLSDDFLDAGLMKLEDIRELCIEVVIYGALADALPMLDVVLTPNGMATVGNQNLVPASAARSEAARKALAGLLFEAQENLLDALRQIPDWLRSPYALFFRQSLFNSLTELCRLNFNRSEDSFDLAIVMQQIAAHAENRIAGRYISHELMAVLRDKALDGSLSKVERHVVHWIKIVVADMIRNNSKDCGSHDMIDLVEFIRNRPEDFPEWHSSALSVVYSDQSFQNDRNSGGFFF